MGLLMQYASLSSRSLGGTSQPTGHSMPSFTRRCHSSIETIPSVFNDIMFSEHPSMDGRHMLLLMSEALVLIALIYGVILSIRHFISSRYKVQAIRRSLRPSTCPFAGQDSEKACSLTDISTLAAYELPPVKNTGSSCMTMGLKRLDLNNWLTIDPAAYIAEHKLRKSMIENYRQSVFECLPGSEAACREALDEVVSFLTSRYPQYFQLIGMPTMQNYAVYNKLTGETSPLHKSRVPWPLQTAALLAQEDINILFPSSHPAIMSPSSPRIAKPLPKAKSTHHLLASATLFPAGWKLQERIGGTIGELHNPVPGWAKKLGCTVDQYLDHLGPRTAMERCPVFVQGDGEFWKDGDLNGRCDEVEVAEVKVLLAENLHLRRERQTFRRLKKSGAVLFTVHSFMKPIVDIGDEELKALIGVAERWDLGMAGYKGREEWLEVAREYAQRRGIDV